MRAIPNKDNRIAASIHTPSDNASSTSVVTGSNLLSEHEPKDLNQFDSSQVNFNSDLKRKSYSANPMKKSDTLSTSLRSESVAVAMAVAVSTSMRPESAHAGVSVRSVTALPASIESSVTTTQAKSRIAVRSVELFENSMYHAGIAARSAALRFNAGPNYRFPIQLPSEPESPDIEESDAPFTSLSNLMPENHPLFHHVNKLFDAFNELTVTINEMKFKSDYSHTLTMNAQCQLARMSDTVGEMNRIHDRMNGV